MRRLFWVPFLALLAACPGPIDTGADGGGAIVVGPQGGKFFREGAVLDIPANAVASETTLTVEVIDDERIPTVPGRARISYGYLFHPSALQFKEPVTLALPYLEERIPAKGIDPTTFDLRRGTGDDPFLALPAPSTLTELKVVSASTDGLGLFWITSPPRPAVNELKLSPEEAQLQAGQSQQFTAQVTDPAGNPLPEVEVKWSIVPARVAQVDPSGKVDALSSGIATLTATAGDQVATARVSVFGTTVGPQTFLHENPWPTGNDLYGGVIAGNGRVYFAGGNATVLEKNQSIWSRYNSGPAITLHAIGGGLPDGAVAVGVSGNAGVLIEVTDPDKTPVVKVLNSVQPLALAFDGTYGMAVGTGNDVVIRRNGQWETDYSPSFETLLDVKGDGTGGFVTVGSRGSLYVYDPATQTWDSLFQTQLNVLLTDAVITDGTGNEAWAIGGNKLWHFAQSAWSALNLPSVPAVDTLTAVGLIDGKVIVAGRRALRPFVFRYDPSTGAFGTTTQLRLQQVVRDIFGTGNEGYVVGDLGSIWHYQSGTLTEVSRGFYGDVADVFASSVVQVAAVNECADDGCQSRNGAVMIREAGGVWSPLGAPVFTGRLFGIAANSPADVYATGEGSIWHYDGTGWTPAFLSAQPIYDIAVCGSTIWAAGASGVVLRGTNFNSLAPVTGYGSRDLRAVYCRDANEVWIAGDKALFRNKLQVFDPAVNHASYQAVWSPGSNEAFAFGLGNYGVYYDTQNLSVIQAPGGIYPAEVTGLWGSAPDNLYAVAWTVNPLTFGYGLRFNGGQWTLVDTGSQQKPSSVHGYSDTDLFVGTAGGGILRGVPPATP